MDKKCKLAKKVKRLLGRLGCPRWLHRFGPKTYEAYEHFSALLVRHYCRLSYNGVVHLFDLLGLRCPRKSALQAMSAKLRSGLWQRALKLTSGSSYLVAMDSTGFARSSPSYHYLKRIDGHMPRVPVKLNCAFDTRKKKFCAAKIRVRAAHDTNDAKHLMRKSGARIIVADKSYSSEALFAHTHEHDQVLMIPKRKRARKGFYRQKMYKRFRTRTYNRRQIGESGFKTLKHCYGNSVSSKKATTIRSELYGRMLTHNLPPPFR